MNGNEFDVFDVLTGEFLKKCRIKSNQTQLDVAQKMNKSRSWLAEIERGRRAIGWQDMKRLCIILDTNPNEVGKYIDLNIISNK